MFRWRLGILVLALLVSLGGAAMALADTRAPSIAIEALQQSLPPSGAWTRDLVGGKGAATQDALPAYTDLRAPLAGLARPPRGGGESLDSQLTLTSVADATILQNLGDRNFGDTTDMWVGLDQSTDPAVGVTRSLVRFDLSPLPAGSNISSATLKLFLVNSWDVAGASKTVTAYRMDGSWTETAVTWSNAPAYAEAYGSASVTHGDWKYYDLDVTDLVRAWSSGAHPNYGIMVRGQESNLGRRGFGTREVASEGDYFPLLVIDYTAGGPTPTATTPAGLEARVSLPIIRKAPMPTATPTWTPVPAPTNTPGACPQAGAWTGQESQAGKAVSFTVTQGCQVRDFRITVPYGISSCGVHILVDIPISNGGFRIESDDVNTAFTFEGAFTAPNRASGTYAVYSCGGTASGVSRGTWTAQP